MGTLQDLEPANVDRFLHQAIETTTPAARVFFHNATAGPRYQLGGHCHGGTVQTAGGHRIPLREMGASLRAGVYRVPFLASCVPLGEGGRLNFCRNRG